MELSRLLGTSFACDCGRVHAVPVRRFLYERDAVESLPEILEQCGERSRDTVVVADVRTWEVCGRRVQDVLTKAGVKVARVIVPDGRSGGPVCDDVTVGPLVEQLRGLHPDLVVAVGSGVINDLSKWAGFQLGVPYLVVATAASMNGYSAANVAPTIAGVKMLIKAKPPVTVIAEPAVIEQSPREMTAAGFGDTIAKHQSNADWVTNRMLFDEYYCKFCASIVTDIEPLYLERPEDIRDGKAQAIGGSVRGPLLDRYGHDPGGHKRPGQRRRAPVQPHVGHDGGLPRRAPRSARPASGPRHCPFRRSVPEGPGHGQSRPVPFADSHRRAFLVRAVGGRLGGRAVRVEEAAVGIAPTEDRAARHLGPAPGRRGAPR